MSRLFRRRSPTTPSPAVSPANVGVPPAPAQVPVGPWTLRGALTRSWLGRILLVIWVAQVAVGDVGGWLSGGLTPARALWRAVASAAVVVMEMLLVRLLGTARRRLLWRVRRPLILSYIFIGVVPALLLVAFFVFAGLLMFFHVSAYLFKRGIDDIVDEARTVAETAAIEIRRASGPGSAGAVLERKVANAAPRYAGVSLAVVPRAASRPAGGPAPVTTSCVPRTAG